MKKERILDVYCGTLDEAITVKEKLEKKGCTILSTEIGSSAPGNWIKLVYQRKRIEG